LSSRRQSCVALSTTESEYVAACEAAREGVWLQRLLMDMNLGSEKPLSIYLFVCFAHLRPFILVFEREC
jgi:hypothetical protein